MIEIVTVGELQNPVTGIARPFITLMPFLEDFDVDTDPLLQQKDSSP